MSQPTPPRSTRSMNGWIVLEGAIPRGEAEEIADLMGVAPDTIRRWRREPEADDDRGTGRRSPLDQLLLLLNAVYARHPGGAELIADRIAHEMAQLRAIHGQPAPLLAAIEGDLREVSRLTARVADSIAGCE